ncbi:MAG: tetratricopeptide repeat protein [Thermoguttaceae bacterium]
MGRRSEEKLAKVGVKAPQPVMTEQPDTNQAAAVEPPDAKGRQKLRLPPAVERWLRGHGVELGVCLFLVLATLAVFGRTIGHDFVSYDDDNYVYGNRHVRGGLTLEAVKWALTHVHSANWHPLTTLSHMLDCSLYGLWAPGHHLTNLLLHAAGSVMLFLALRRLTGAVWRSSIVAALFCLHPLHVESVAWVSERKDVLSGLFFGLTLWAYAGYAQRPFSWVRYLAVIVLFALGLLCKPMLVTVPFLLLLLDYWPLGRWQGAGGSGQGAGGREQGARARGQGVADGRETNQGRQSSFVRLVMEKLPLMALSAGSCTVTYLIQRSAEAIGEGAPLGLRIQTALLAYVGYLMKMLWPANLALPYPPQRQPAILACVLCFLVLSGVSGAVIVAMRRGMPYLAVGWFWYVGMLVPVSGIVLIGEQAMADRYTYLPLVGIFIAMVWGGADLLGRAGVAWGFSAVAILLALCASDSYWQLRYWRDSEALYRHALAATENNVQAHTNLGIVLWGKGPERHSEAMAHFSEAIRIKGDDYHARNNLGSILYKQGNYQGAIENYLAALQAKPSYALAHNNLGVALLKLGRGAEAEQAFREALRLNPEYDDAENNLGMALAMQNRWSEAIPHYRRALELAPEEAQPHMNLGLALAAEGSVVEGVKECEAAVKMNPEDVDGHNELAKLYHSLGRLREAADQWAEVLRRNPAHAAAAKGLGMVLVKAGRGRDAVPLLQVAVAAAPRDLEARKYKAFAHVASKQPREAMAEFREILRQDPKNQNALNSLAWIEATHADAAIRHGKDALELAQKAVGLQKNDVPELLDTLAAAYAEAGRFEEAVVTARKAKKAAQQRTDRALLDGIDARLKLYESGKPYREEGP